MVIRTIDKFSILFLLFFSFNLSTVCASNLRAQICYVEFCNSLSMLHLFHYFSIYFFFLFSVVPTIIFYPSCFVQFICPFISKCYASSILRRQPSVIIITTAVFELLLLLSLWFWPSIRSFYAVFSFVARRRVFINYI